MKLTFFCEKGTTPEIGTGHYYRSKWIVDCLWERGHAARIISNYKLPEDTDVLVIDDLRSHRRLISKAKYLGAKVVLIDGPFDDVPYADLVISAFYNKKAHYSGIEYMAFLPRGDRKFDKTKTISNDPVFVSMGGFDANNLTPMVLKVVREFGLKAIVTKSINHPDFGEWADVEVYEGDDYYIPMSKCSVGIVNGGLTMFQALHFGLPSLAIPQYTHQQELINAVDSGCIETNSYMADIRTCLNILLRDPNYRNYLSDVAQNLVDGGGINRVCDLIEKLKI